MLIYSDVSFGCNNIANCVGNSTDLTDLNGFHTNTLPSVICDKQTKSKLNSRINMKNKLLFT